MGGRSWTAVAAVAVGFALLAPAAWAPLGSSRLVPASGAHWKANAGLADRVGGASQALVLERVIGRAAGNDSLSVARIEGFEGQRLSALSPLGFSLNDGAGLQPCTRIVYTAADGREAELMIHVEEMRAERVADGWTHYSYEGALPEGTVRSLSIVAAWDPNTSPDPNVRLDDITVGTDVWDSAFGNAR